MIRIFTLLIISLFYQALKAQIVNGDFEAAGTTMGTRFWAGKTYSFKVILDSSGKSIIDSVVFDKTNYAITNTKVHSGNWALELRNGYNFSQSQLLPGQVFASNDTSGYAGFQNTLVPVTATPDALQFYCSYLPKQADTGLAIIKVYDASMNEIGFGQYRIERGIPAWEQITVPIDYSSLADAAFVQLSFASSTGGNKVSLGTVLFVDDIELLNFTSMDVNQLLNPVDIYPNPSSGAVKLNVRKNVRVSEVFLVNMGGQVLPVKSSSEGVYWTDNLDDGIYVVVLKGNNLFTKYKLIVKR